MWDSFEGKIPCLAYCLYYLGFSTVDFFLLMREQQFSANLSQQEIDKAVKIVICVILSLIAVKFIFPIVSWVVKYVKDLQHRLNKEEAEKDRILTNRTKQKKKAIRPIFNLRSDGKEIKSNKNIIRVKIKTKQNLQSKLNTKIDIEFDLETSDRKHRKIVGSSKKIKCRTVA